MLLKGWSIMTPSASFTLCDSLLIVVVKLLPVALSHLLTVIRLAHCECIVEGEVGGRVLDRRSEVWQLNMLHWKSRCWGNQLVLSCLLLESLVCCWSNTSHYSRRRIARSQYLLRDLLIVCFCHQGHWPLTTSGIVCQILSLFVLEGLILLRAKLVWGSVVYRPWTPMKVVLHTWIRLNEIVHSIALIPFLMVVSREVFGPTNIGKVFISVW